MDIAGIVGIELAATRRVRPASGNLCMPAGKSAGIRSRASAVPVASHGCRAVVGTVRRPFFRDACVHAARIDRFRPRTGAASCSYRAGLRATAGQRFSMHFSSPGDENRKDRKKIAKELDCLRILQIFLRAVPIMNL